MADAADFDRFFRPAAAHPEADVRAAEAAFAATPPLRSASELGAARGWGHVPLPAGVLHPALLEVATAQYDADAATVREVADEGGLEGGPLSLLVPVAPPEARHTRGLGGRAIGNGVDARLRLLLRRAAVARHLIERHEDEALVAAARGAMQRAFDALVREVGGADTLWLPAPADRARLRPGGAPPTSDPWRDVGLDPPDPRRPIGCALAGERRLLVFPFALLLLEPRGRVAWSAAAPDLTLAYAGDGLARFTRDERAYALRLADARWLDAWPDGASATFVEERREQAWLVDARAGRARELFEVAEPAHIARFTPDGSYAWVEDAEEAGGVFDSARGLLQLAADELALPFDAPAEDGWERSFRRGAPDHAVAVGRDQALRLFRVDTLQLAGARHRLPPADAAAFTPDATQLLCADAAELRLYDLAGVAPALIERVELAPLAARLTPP